MDVKTTKTTKRPKTRKRAGAGYMTSRWNATKHGLAAEHSVLSGEDPKAFEELKQRYFAEWKPAGPTAEYLVNQLVEIEWKFMRFRRFEHAELRQALFVKLMSAVRTLEDGKIDDIGVNELAIAHKSAFLPHTDSVLEQVFVEPMAYTSPDALIELQSDILDLVENEPLDEFGFAKAKSMLPPKLRELWLLALRVPGHFNQFVRSQGLPPVRIEENTWKNFETWVFDFALPYLDVLRRRHPMALAVHKHMTELAYLEATEELAHVSQHEERLHRRYQKVLASLLALQEKQEKASK